MQIMKTTHLYVNLDMWDYKGNRIELLVQLKIFLIIFRNQLHEHNLNETIVHVFLSDLTGYKL